MGMKGDSTQSGADPRVCPGRTGGCAPASPRLQIHDLGPYSICSSLRTRSSMGGWVENKDAIPPPERGNLSAFPPAISLSR